MAKKSETNVTRITASDASTGTKTKAPKSKTTKAKTVKAITDKPNRKLWKPLALVLGYFKGAWLELRQVHWPTRGATWSLTAAVLGFSAFFVVYILLLDALFKYLFELILK